MFECHRGKSDSDSVPLAGDSSDRLTTPISIGREAGCVVEKSGQCLLRAWSGDDRSMEEVSLGYSNLKGGKFHELLFEYRIVTR
jgi:hypothetical protein